MRRRTLRVRAVAARRVPPAAGQFGAGQFGAGQFGACLSAAGLFAAGLFAAGLFAAGPLAAQQPSEPAAPPQPTGEATGGRAGVVGSARSQADWLQILSSPIVGVRPMGVGRLRLEARLEGGERAELLLPSHGQPELPRSAVAQYRVAGLLGLENAAPAVLVRVRRADLEAGLHPDFAEQWPAIAREVHWDDDGSAEASLSAWVEPLRDFGLHDERGAWMARLGRWGGDLDGRYPDRDLSCLRLFDYLIGSTRRFERPLYETADRTRVFFQPVDGAFPGALSPTAHRDLRRRALGRMARFSRVFLERLRRATDRQLEEALEHEGSLLVAAPALDGLRDRRDALITYIVAWRDYAGEADTLVFE